MAGAIRRRTRRAKHGADFFAVDKLRVFRNALAMPLSRISTLLLLLLPLAPGQGGALAQGSPPAAPAPTVAAADKSKDTASPGDADADTADDFSDADLNVLTQSLASISAEGKSSMLRTLFDTLSLRHVGVLHHLADGAGLPLHELVLTWTGTTQKEWDAVFARADALDGFHEQGLRVPLIHQLAQRDPLAAARVMGTELDPHSTSYFYYTVIDGLLPGLLTRSAAELMPIFQHIASGDESLDQFRWSDSVQTLLQSTPPWQSPDLAADWKYIIAQKPGTLRTLLLGLVLNSRLRLDFDQAITTPIEPLQEDHRALRFVVQEAFPKNPELALKLLPIADPILMGYWVDWLIEGGVAPDWPAWAKQMLTLEPGSGRTRALALFTRLWLQKDEDAAHQWSAGLTDASARAIMMQEVTVHDIIAEAAENWTTAQRRATALTAGPAREAALLGVFQAGIYCDREEIDICIKAATTDAAFVSRLWDAWTLGRLADASSSTSRYQEIYPIILSLRDPVTRDRLAEAHRYVATVIGLEKIEQAIQAAPLSVEEKKRHIQACLIVVVSHQLSERPASDKPAQGVTVSEEDARRDPIAALEVSMRIEDPHHRWLIQRHLLRNTAEDDLKRAKEIITAARLDDPTRKSLLEEWNKISQWAQR